MKKKSKHSHKKDSSMFFIFVAISIVIVFVVCVISYQFFITNKVQCANTISCKSPPKFEMQTNARGIFSGRPISVPNIDFTQNGTMSPVLGTETYIGEKHIYVNLDTQTLTAYEGENIFMETPVSTGLWGRTPKGDFTIWTKIRSTRMSGGSGADYYDLPNVPYVMFFSNNEVAASTGFSIHGTYWHNNFGHAMSHGCVNMKTTDVAKLFEWAEGPKDGKKGTTITIYDDSKM